MSEQTERKLQQVAIAQFGYRHEAEFAAGFLEDAGIPLRLQIDDPAMGLSVSGAATIWVREMDAARSREILEIEEGRTKGLSLYGGQPAQPSPPGIATTRTTASEAAWPSIDSRGRALAGVGAAAALYSLRFVYVATGPLSVLAIAGALGLGAIALIGRAPRWVRDLFRSLSGDAP